MSNAVLFDTSFFIRLLNKTEKLHENAKGYYRYFLDNEYTLKISTISIAEYCVIGERSDLPLKQLMVSPFNIDDAEQTGHFAHILFQNKKAFKKKALSRLLIPNDSKLFAQAHCDPDVIYYVTADTRSETSIKILNEDTEVNFRFVDIHTPWNEQFGELFS
jgi:predicted nucleic acid-binding protein